MEELDELERNLRAIRDAVAQGDEDRLRRLLQKAGEIKRQVG